MRLKVTQSLNVDNDLVILKIKNPEEVDCRNIHTTCLAIATIVQTGDPIYAVGNPSWLGRHDLRWNH